MTFKQFMTGPWWPHSWFIHGVMKLFTGGKSSGLSVIDNLLNGRPMFGEESDAERDNVPEVPNDGFKVRMPSTNKGEMGRKRMEREKSKDIRDKAYVAMVDFSKSVRNVFFEEVGMLEQVLYDPQNRQRADKLANLILTAKEEDEKAAKAREDAEELDKEPLKKYPRLRRIVNDVIHEENVNAYVDKLLDPKPEQPQQQPDLQQGGAVLGGMGKN